MALKLFKDNTDDTTGNYNAYNLFVILILLILSEDALTQLRIIQKNKKNNEIKIQPSSGKKDEIRGKDEKEE